MASNSLSLQFHIQIIPDISDIIFSLCTISDKRGLIKTCKTNNMFKHSMHIYEKQFKKNINESKLLYRDVRFTRFDNILFRHTLELIYDGYYRLIPDRYFCQQNQIMTNYPGIYEHIAQIGDLSLIKKFSNIEYTYMRKNNYQYITYGATQFGQISILDWLIENKYYHNYMDTTSYAAKGNQFELLKQMVNKGYMLVCSTTKYAIKNANTEMIRWLIEDCDCSSYDCVYVACEKSRLDIIKMLYKKRRGSVNQVCNIAIYVGDIDILKWGLSKGYKITNHEYSDKKYGGHAHMLEWLTTNGHIKQKNDKLSKNAVHAGNLEVLKWTKANGFPICSDVYINKINNNGVFECLKFIVENGSELATSTIYEIAEYGNKVMLEWALSTKCDFSGAKLCEAAARNGKLSMLKYLHGKGFRSDKICEWAIDAGHLKILEWAYENGCELNAKMCKQTVRNNNLDILKWLRERGCPWNDELCKECIQCYNLDMLEWITKNSFKWNNHLCKMLLDTDNYTMCEWYESNKSKIMKTFK